MENTKYLNISKTITMKLLVTYGYHLVGNLAHNNIDNAGIKAKIADKI